MNCHRSTVAHGHAVTSSTSSLQITEVKHCRAQLVLGWVDVARVMLPAMCRGVGQASRYHAIPVHPAVDRDVCGRTRKLNCNDWL